MGYRLYGTIIVILMFFDTKPAENKDPKGADVQHHSGSITAPFWNLFGYQSASDMIYRRFIKPTLKRFNEEEFPQLVEKVKGKIPESIDEGFKHISKKAKPYVIGSSVALTAAGLGWYMINKYRNTGLAGLLWQCTEFKENSVSLKNKIALVSKNSPLWNKEKEVIKSIKTLLVGSKAEIENAVNHIDAQSQRDL